MRTLAILTLAFAASGCTATILSDEPSAANAPAGSRTGKSSTVVYNPDGAKELVDMRREDAFKKIVAWCGTNKYRVDAEDTMPASETEQSDGSLATTGASRLRHVRFTCL